LNVLSLAGFRVDRIAKVSQEIRGDINKTLMFDDI
jgi:hypothetical protein